MRSGSVTLPCEPYQTVGKPGLHPKKAMLSIWWDCRGPIYYELLPMNETINSEKYCSQLEILKAVIEEKRPGLANRHGVVFHQDNARPDVSVKTMLKLKGFGWDILNHPPYSPDIASLDYYLFQSMEHSLRRKNFFNLKDIQNHLDKFFASKPEEFYRTGIEKLPGLWQMVLENNGVH